jgi:hypothetical protein
VLHVVDVDVDDGFLLELDHVSAYEEVPLRLDPEDGLPARRIVSLFQVCSSAQVKRKALIAF